VYRAPTPNAKKMRIGAAAKILRALLTLPRLFLRQDADRRIHLTIR
jgi:hypothetical protein